MKIFKILIIICLFCSCSNPLDKSILEPLEVEELKKVIKSDTTFENLYTKIQTVRESILENELKQVKWVDLSYQSLLDYKEFRRDTSIWNPLRQKNFKLWKQENDTTGFSNKVDSISNYWKNYFNENDLSNHVKVELVKLDKEYYYSGGLRHVNLGFRLTPLKGKLDQVIFSYNLKPKITEDKNTRLSISDLLDRNRCLYSRPLYSSKTSYWKCDYSDEDILENKSLTSLKRDYNLNIVVEEIRKNGVNYDKDDIDIPFSIEQLWKEEQITDSYMYDYYKIDIYKEYIDSDFIEFWEYYDEKKIKILKEKFPLEFEFEEIIKSKNYD